MQMANNVIEAYRAQQEAMKTNIAAWTDDNPELARILEEARQEAEQWVM
jgi:hypothetical protein